MPEEEAVLEEDKHPVADESSDPEMLLLRETDRQLIQSALRRLPKEFMEVIVLREFEELSYKQIAEMIQIPCGTVMSRLARARKRLVQLLLAGPSGCDLANAVANDSRASCP
jgi:RNA polymerase sigma-70 factor (ECF subfamily)